MRQVAEKVCWNLQEKCKRPANLPSSSDYERCCGAGPGRRISGSIVRTCVRVTKKTAAVQVGKRSSPGTSSAAKVGRKAQCQPRIFERMAAVAISSATSAGDTPPAKNNGKPMIWTASAMMATNQALRCSVERTGFKKSKRSIKSSYKRYICLGCITLCLTSGFIQLIL